MRHLAIRVLANTVSFVCARALALSVLLFLPHLYGQACDSNDSIYQGGQYCITAGSLTGNSPQMPQLSYGGSGSSCDTYSYTMELDFTQSQSTPYGNAQSYGLYNSGSVNGNVPWIVNWSLNQGDVGQYAEGGNGWIDITENGYYSGGFSFFVYGQNPSNNSIAANARLYSPPWWYGLALTKESSNRQFYNWQSQYDPSGTYTGTPIYGPPDGFGLAQVDGSGANAALLTDAVMWTWTTNLMTGISIANSKQNAAFSYWSGQLSSMLSDTAGSSPQYPWQGLNIGTACQFTSWTGTGQNAFGNTEWMTEYNGGHFATWYGVQAGWGERTGYVIGAVGPQGQWVPGICNQVSYTL